jgi:oxygen-independent coproporphyrinogen-3 oxidase
MRTLATSGTRVELERLLGQPATADYVYMYPPRQAYGPANGDELEVAITRSLARQGAIDLYLHFPFCRQICSFCNLYAVVATARGLFERYVDALLQEAETYAPLLRGKPVDTVYLGGGTPSQLPAELIAALLTGLERLYGFDRREVPEVALEVAPDTVTPERLAAFREAGINRVNLGVQTVSDVEMRLIGRRHDAGLPLAAASDALQAGFENVCVDLIYGLDGQTDRSWRESVDRVIELGPATVCAYSLTLRPRTGYSARGFAVLDHREQIKRYDYAHQALVAAGYAQETHVRWARGPNGGYRQKANHWALSNVVGLGAGARGYLWECDYRNGYSVRHRMPVLGQWFDRVEAHGHGRTDGFLMDHDERLRKATILGLHRLDRQRFASLLGCDVTERFGLELEAMAALRLVEIEADSVTLTDEGMRHRDVLVQAFFSSRVRASLAAFDYDHD